jgi:hypothetical protein
MALGCCLGRPGSDEPAQPPEEWTAIPVRGDSARADFVTALRLMVFAADLEPFRDTFREAAFEGFAFKRRDLSLAEGRLAAFRIALVFDFDFVAIRCRNLYGLCRLKSRRPWQTICKL